MPIIGEDQLECWTAMNQNSGCHRLGTDGRLASESLPLMHIWPRQTGTSIDGLISVRARDKASMGQAARREASQKLTPQFQEPVIGFLTGRRYDLIPSREQPQ
jgi:hypothetical protein